MKLWTVFLLVLLLCPLIARGQGYAVRAWGDNSAGQLNVPLYLTDAVAIAGGLEHSLALKNDGTVVGWGGDSAGQIDIPEEATNVIAIAAGYDHSLALRSDGIVVGWGSDTNGQITIPAQATNVTAIAAGPNTSLALSADGTVIGWGQDQFGQTNGAAAGSNVIAIACGYHGLALRQNTTVVGWGANFWGQTNGAVAGSNVLAIAAGVNHSLALKADHTVVAWGRNLEGQTNVPSGLSNVVAVAAGLEQSLALTENGRVTGWGRNLSGEAIPPASLANEIVVGIAAGPLHSLALTMPVLSDLQASETVPRLTLLASNGVNYQLEYLETLGPTNMWSPLTNGLITTQPQFHYEVSAAGLAHRLYRLSSSNAISMLEIHAVPRVTLLAETNREYLLEYRLASGPSNSWVFLDSVYLTNFPQFYFDDSAIGQPRRLYRLVTSDSP